MTLRSRLLLIGLMIAWACAQPSRDPDDLADGTETTCAETTCAETTSPMPSPAEPTEAAPRGWCCDCDSKIGKALSCTPATADSCIGTTLAWCELDQDGTPSACEAKCDALGWCCDCSGQPVVECWRTPEDACSYQWCRSGPLACTDTCPSAVCCDRDTMSCWHSDGIDCDEPHEHWCVAGVDCFADCE